MASELMAVSQSVQPGIDVGARGIIVGSIQASHFDYAVRPISVAFTWPIN